MEQQQAPVKREWPKWLWGPDGKKARFDSPSDVPRDYTEEEQAPRIEAPSSPRSAPSGSSSLSPEVREMIREEVRAEMKALAAAKMEKARAARKSKE